MSVTAPLSKPGPVQGPSPVSGKPNRSGSECQKIGQVLGRIGDKWTMVVISELGEGPVRFNELQRRIEGVSQRMLTLTLRNLERDGLVSRAVTPSIPPRVDYDLTDLGRSMLGPVHAMAAWVQIHMPQMDAARLRYDTEER